jgi:pimeloyl-ACP methyl ester carboxylesterase
MSNYEAQNWVDLSYFSQDNLRLHARHYPAAEAQGRPVLCLSGLSRNGRDFQYLAAYLSGQAPRRRDVYCLDYRGRGLSQYDRNWRNYTPAIELMDTLDFMTAFGVHSAAIVGTSRGGIIAMMLAAFRPVAMGPVVLNDVGPVLETQGMARIVGYIGRTPTPNSWEDAGRLLREMNERAFPGLSQAEWEELARQAFNERDGRPSPGYDPRLGKMLGSVDLSRPMPTLWPQFTALTRFPTLVIRGSKSDLLSEATLAAMVERHPNLRSLTVRDQGHAPLLREPETVETIGAFLAAND